MSKTKKSDVKSWKNRIVGHAEVDPKTLLEHPCNYRVHGLLQQKTLEEAIRSVGFIKSVTVNKTSGRIIDGHLRVKLAIDKGEKTIPVEYVELSPKEERLAIAVMDPLTALATQDDAKLEKLAKELDGQPAEIRALINGLKDEELTLPPEDETSTVTFHRRADTKVTIGMYRFSVKRKKYQKWVDGLKNKHGHEEEKIIAAIKELLGL